MPGSVAVSVSCGVPSSVEYVPLSATPLAVTLGACVSTRTSRVESAPPDPRTTLRTWKYHRPSSISAKVTCGGSPGTTLMPTDDDSLATTASRMPSPSTSPRASADGAVQLYESFSRVSSVVEKSPVPSFVNQANDVEL